MTFIRCSLIALLVCAAPAIAGGVKLSGPLTKVWETDNSVIIRVAVVPGANGAIIEDLAREYDAGNCKELQFEILKAGGDGWLSSVGGDWHHSWWGMAAIGLGYKTKDWLQPYRPTLQALSAEQVTVDLSFIAEAGFLSQEGPCDFMTEHSEMTFEYLEKRSLILGY